MKEPEKALTFLFLKGSFDLLSPKNFSCHLFKKSIVSSKKYFNRPLKFYSHIILSIFLSLYSYVVLKPISRD